MEKFLSNIIILLKNNDQDFIVFVKNPIFYFKIKHINIQHYYIYKKINSEKIKLFFISIKKNIIDNLIKALIYFRFYIFVK